MAEIEDVVAEPVDVVGLIGAETGQGFVADGDAVPAHGEVIERVGHAHDGMEDEQVCDEVVVFDCLALLVALGGRGEAAVAERDPLGVAVEVLALVGRGLDDAPELDRLEVRAAVPVWLPSLFETRT